MQSEPSIWSQSLLKSKTIAGTLVRTAIPHWRKWTVFFSGMPVVMRFLFTTNRSCQNTSFNHESHSEMQLIKEEGVAQIMSCLSERQQYLIQKCFLEGWSCTDLAALEGKDESAIRHAVDRAKKKLRKFLE